ncbi:MAG: XdhC family protein [Gemmatimonadota bacterium]|jgi:xanthine dehydrogenase accessory factor|nr:MAG: XdhC family protein [Gemmatimonadota bacterium]
MSRTDLLEVLEPLERWTRDGTAAGLATLIGAQRSAPRRPGARFAVSEAGELAGSVSAGCVEGDLHEHLRQILGGAEARRLTYGITDEMAAEVGLACGGEIEVFVERFDADDPAWRAVREAIEQGQPAVLLTGVSGGVEGRRLLAVEGAPPVGRLVSGPEDARLIERARPSLDTGCAGILELTGPKGTVHVFVEPLLPPARLVIVGASQAAAALCRLGSLLGFEVCVVDPRSIFLTRDRFPDAARLIEAWPAEGLGEIGLDRFASVVVLAHDRKLDVPALETALEAGCRYVGQIGGRRTQRLRREALAEQGVGAASIARVRGPVGLDIGAETPAEIALAILAEVVAVAHGRA